MSNSSTSSKQFNAAPFVFVGLGVAYLVFFLLRDGGGASGREHHGVGQSVTDVSFAALTAEQATSSDEWRGNVVLINFWGTWCPPCRKEFPHIVQLHRRFESNPDFQLVSISSPSSSLDVTALRESTAAYVAQSGATFPTYYDAMGRSQRQIIKAAKLSSGGIPMTVILDREGVIRGVWQGFREGDEVEMAEVVAETLGKG